MTRCAPTLTMALVVASLLAVTGCGENPQERIALLEQDNQRLIDELGMARTDADAARRDLALCEQDQLTCRRDAEDLRAQLAALAAREPEPLAEVPEGWTPVPGGAMIAIEGEVLFRSGKTTLRPEARRALDAVARTVNSEYVTQDVLVYGHTDNVPIKKSGWKDNLELSAQRALAVVRYLESRGVAPSRLVAAGCGEHRPIGPNSSAEAQAKNRRVEVYALDAVVQSAGR